MAIRIKGDAIPFIKGTAKPGQIRLLDFLVFEKPGVTSFSYWGEKMNKILILLFPFFLLTACVNWSEKGLNEEELVVYGFKSRSDVELSRDENILHLFLLHAFDQKDGFFTVINPLTDIGVYEELDEKQIVDYCRSIESETKISYEKICPAFRGFLKVNLGQRTLTLKPDIDLGYAVDTRGRYASYFGKWGGDWERWYKENDRAKGYVSLSIPYYDETTEIGILYFGILRNSLDGWGGLIIFTLRDGKFEELGSRELWIS